MVKRLIRQDENTRPGRVHSRLFLYKLFYYLQHIRELTKTKGSFPSSLRVCRQEVATTKFQQEFVKLMLELSDSDAGFSDSSITFLVEKSIKMALSQMVKLDLSNFQRNAKGAISRALSISSVVATGVKAGVAPFWLPPLNCLAHLFNDSLLALNKPEMIFEYGIAKFFIGKGALSMDRSKQVVLAESAVTKRVLDIFLALQKLPEEEHANYFNGDSFTKVKIKHSLLSATAKSESIIFKLDEDSDFKVDTHHLLYRRIEYTSDISQGQGFAKKLAFTPTYQLYLLREDAKALLGSKLSSAPEKAEHLEAENSTK